MRLESEAPESEAGEHGIGGITRRYFHQAQEAFKAWLERRALLQELLSLDDEMLADMGLTRGQIPYLVQAHPQAGKLLDAMLKRLKLDTDTQPLDDLTREDLYRNCVMCQERGECRQWLAAPRDPGGYRAFCPNAWLLDKLQEKAAEPQKAH